MMRTTTTTWPRLLCSCRFLLFILVVTAFSQHQQHLAFASSGSGSRRVVTSLPGFDGPLPFHLETGYVEVDEDNGTELFYYFVESESESGSGGADAPFLLWFTGGDRCSVFSGLAYEIGPIRFVLEPYNGSLPRLRYNPNSWSKVSHILFVDSPVGAGFSFSRQPKGYEVGDASASLQLHEFLIKWFRNHPKYLASPFYIGADSYAGKLVPFLAQMVSEDIEAGRGPLLNLKGYLVGNPITGESVDVNSRVPCAHGFGIISDQLYETILRHCQGEDYTNPANALCTQALGIFNNLISEVQQAQILLDTCVYASPVPKPNSRTDGSDGRKILIMEEIRVGQLNHPPARPPFGCIGSVDEWVRCHDGDLPYSNDLQSSIKYHRNLTSRGYRALVYSGDHDLLVPHLGTQAWVRSLNFPVADDWRAWHLDGQSAGFTISYSNNMTFATIKGGGHTAPEYEPERCFAMFSRWILNRPL
ncbi:serine carboxypeptidase-like 7 isoform X2 [Phragmites australis]|uniref:serine carboxypeptidase-like 7 isoform X2 n=1 Tax=Phragmites australis TaxID=29695 RepID=UPI002D796572|nr:serine carboxypeptidase-like 7 isoform X2 [Phragmites australis]